MLLYFFLGALAVLYLVFFRKKPAAVRAVSTSPALSTPVPGVSKPVSPAAQSLRVRLGLENINRPITISLNNVRNGLLMQFAIHVLNKFLSVQSKLVSGHVYVLDLPRLVQVLEELAHVYLLIQVTSDEEEGAVHETIQSAMPQFPKHRCLLYSLEVGKVAIVRQVIPSVHIEFDRNFCEKLKPHVRKIVWVDGGCVGNVESVELAATQAESKIKTSATSAHSEAAGNDKSSGFTTVASFGDILCL